MGNSSRNTGYRGNSAILTKNTNKVFGAIKTVWRGRSANREKMQQFEHPDNVRKYFKKISKKPIRPSNDKKDTGLT